MLYLYPNSLYAKVSFHNGSITLIRGHGYPTGVSNGFGWKDDTTRFEMDRNCTKIQFVKVTNGFALDCYPEYSMIAKSIWDKILN